MSFRISDKIISRNSPCFIIAEIAQAHDGSLGNAHAMIDLVASVGADAVKFQTHIADAETTIDEPFRVNFSYADKTRFAYWKRMEFTPEQWAGLFDHARDVGLIPLSSAFSLQAVELLKRLNIEAWKIASGEYSNFDLLEPMLKTKKPILLSTGMSDLNELDLTVSLINASKAPLAIFQCTSSYPTPLEEVGLNLLPELAAKFHCAVGLSDHSGKPFPAISAMALGAQLIEAHICYHHSQFGPDTVASLDPKQFKLVVEARDAIYTMMQNPVDKASWSKKTEGVRKMFTRSLALKDDMPQGTVLTGGMLVAKKPGTGIPVIEKDRLIGKTLARDVAANRLLRIDDIYQ